MDFPNELSEENFNLPRYSEVKGHELFVGGPRKKRKFIQLSDIVNLQ
jgi:hypothetical protein